MQDIILLENNLKVVFKNKDLLRQALVHRSYINEHPGFELNHNERLEFLGDAVLELVITEYLYHNYPNSEGELTNWRAALVNANMLAEVATKLDVEPHLYLSKGEAKDSNSKARQYIMADAMEAIIGGLYLDQGYRPCQEFIKMHILVHLSNILEEKSYLDPKSLFQEAAQDKIGVTPSYKVLSETGPDHKKHFIVGIYLADELLAEGEGSSKQDAQVEAARKGLVKKGWL